MCGITEALRELDSALCHAYEVLPQQTQPWPTEVAASAQVHERIAAVYERRCELYRSELARRDLPSSLVSDAHTGAHAQAVAHRELADRYRALA